MIFKGIIHILSFLLQAHCSNECVQDQGPLRVETTNENLRCGRKRQISAESEIEKKRKIERATETGEKLQKLVGEIERSDREIVNLIEVAKLNEKMKNTKMGDEKF
ncbi:hypothetical protein ENBRE01_0567 [Enteropsectra breve]|nr:hypothetical protein ENBRE01_0567 [Enteropsectra breve]